MPIHNADIASVFGEIADLLDISGDNPFRIRAYRNAARTVLDLSRELQQMVEQGEDVTALPGIGKDLAKKIEDIVRTGTTPTLDKLRKEVPAGIVELLRLPSLGPKRVKILWKALKIESVHELEVAAREGRVRELEGFGEKTEQQILDAIQIHADQGRRFLRAAVAPYAEALRQFLEDVPGVKRVELAGSYRRAKETVGDVDVLVVAGAKSAVVEQFVAYDEVKEVLAKGDTKSSVVLRSGLQVDLRVVARESFGAALHYFTGSKAHNIAIRKMGQQRGLKVNEYGVFRGEEYVAGATEKDVYKAVDLPFIPPELRENMGEIRAAQEGGLPKLVEIDDIRGDLHMHTLASDGQNTIGELVDTARRRGYEYIAITEHSKRLAMAGGLDEKRVLEQVAEIDAFNAEHGDFRVLKGIEVDILEDGQLDLPDSVLKELDLGVGSVHSLFKLSGEKQTARILRAMENPYFTMLGHPTGRLLLEREPYDVDVGRVIQQARECGCYIELNSHPLRLDLSDAFCRLAREEGVLVSINTDAHGTMDLDYIRYGVGQARRGWLEKKNVLNTRTLKQLRPLLAKTMGHRSRNA